MQKTAFYLMTFLACTLFVSASYTQGCSDAGFCSVGSFKSGIRKDSSVRSSASFGTAIGQGDEAVLVVTPYLQYEVQINRQWSVQSKITANYANGNLGSATNVGDVFLTGTYTSRLRKRWVIQYTFGTKLPLSSGNLSSNGRPLPMQYQSSLGTIDAIAGITLSNNLWQFATAIQQPLSGENKNGFLPVYWNDKEAAMNYPSTNAFLRKADVLLRAARNVVQNKAWNVSLGLLGIYHLAEDSYIDPFVGSNRISIAGSKGLTLNATAAATVQVGRRFQLGLTAGVPLVVRDVRPDGLTRRWVLSPECRFTF
jgi:hypothetical protein